MVLPPDGELGPDEDGEEEVDEEPQLHLVLVTPPIISHVLVVTVSPAQVMRAHLSRSAVQLDEEEDVVVKGK